MDYKETVFLPKTDFPMRAGLPKREPEILAKWADMDLFGKIRAASKGRRKFTLHDGPPYANGHLHMGHALNKILKDLINRSHQMLGKDAVYVPGWDCHGLPIEWKVEEEYRKKGKNKDEIPAVEFRRVCRDFAQEWIGTQVTEFKRLGVEGDFDHHYRTMNFAAEADIFREMSKFLMSGQLYRGSRPVLWSVPERTALADAEVEYYDHTSVTIFVKFPVVKATDPALDGTSIVIWTTTPWTMPGNLAIGAGAEVDYQVIKVTEVAEDSLAEVGARLAVAKALLQDMAEQCGIVGHEVEATLNGAAVAGTIAAHPLRADGFDHDVPVLLGDFVTVDQGTGFVHLAPGHGTDDYELGKKHGLEPLFTVGDDGRFYDHVPLFAGMQVLKDNGKIADMMAGKGALIGRGSLRHSYPHSWRSKAPLIFRNTPQWFISMESHGLRDKALKAIDDTRWIPKQGKNRIRSMIETRPDWCISRQRQWGVPLALFLNKNTGEVLKDETVNDRIAAAFEEEGGDAWFDGDPRRFLTNQYDPAEWDPVVDVIEVWFDSGSTHAFCLERREDLKWPADLYLEGSDQHRGWFHTSLLESCGTRGRAPYDAVLTHGFVLDEKGHKMSKSLGNVITPADIMKEYGADILRLWVVDSDYSVDLRIGKEILKRNADHYRRIRNTLRYILGNLAGFDPAERLDPADMPELDRWVLHRLAVLDGKVRQAIEDYDYHRYFTELHNFCAVDLSAFYFDIRKDALYCDHPSDIRRRAARTVLDELFNCLTAWLAPILCFTAEEAWLARPGKAEEAGSVHLRTFPDLPATWRDDALADKWQTIRLIRRAVTGALEIARGDKVIGASLQASPVVHVTEAMAKTLQGLDLAELSITSGISVTTAPAPDDAYRLEDAADVAVVMAMAEGCKCERCWQVKPEVKPDTHPVCDRCADVLERSAAKVA
ncbi:MAG: isoleucine--tRNA ligase [Alphaproteobacteria bacterium]|nr:isoleucine--tRNA ligase [Alphaproteobacteria bacterium]